MMGNFKFRLRRLGLFVICAFLFAGTISAHAGCSDRPSFASDPNKPLSLGIDFRFLSDVDSKDAVTALNVWALNLPFAKDYQFSAKVFKSSEEIIDEIINGNIQLANSSTVTYLKVKKYVDVEHLFTEVVGGKRTRRYLLLVRNDSSFSGLEALKGRTLAIKSGDEISRLFIDTRLLEGGFKTAESHFGGIHEKRKYSQVVSSVFFRQVDACLVPDYFLSVMNELNPQIGRQLTILMASEELVDRLTFVDACLDEDLKKRIVRDARSMKDYTQGKQMLILFKTDRIETVEESEIEPVRKMLQTYERLLSGKSGGE